MELYYKDLSPPARACYAVMKTLKLPVNLKELESFDDLRSEWFLKLNPAHQFPVLVDNGFALSESRAIMTYLVNKYSPGHPLYPADAKVRAKIDRILYFDGTNLFPAIRENFTPRFRDNVAPSEERNKAVRNSVDELLAMKGTQKFLAGDQVSLADISVVMLVPFFEVFFPDIVEKLQHWKKDVEAAMPVVKEIQDPVDFSFYKNILKATSK